MPGVKEFNTTLFELTDEMMGLIKPSPMMQTGFSLFKTMHAANADNDVAVRAFWDIAKDNQELIGRKDLKAIVAILRGVIPLPGIVDDVWNSLSEENRDIVGEYIVVLNEHASEYAKTAVPSPEKKETGNVTMYRMYNSIWMDFLVTLANVCQDSDRKVLYQEALEKFESVVQAKGVDTEMIFGVLFPSLEIVLPRLSLDNEMAVLKMCIPPTNTVAIVRKDANRLADVDFPFNRKLPFSDILEEAASTTQLGTYWHYIKLFSMCIHQCPPEVVSIMNQMASLFEATVTDDSQRSFLRDEQDVLTK